MSKCFKHISNADDKLEILKNSKSLIKNDGSLSKNDSLVQAAEQLLNQYSEQEQQVIQYVLDNKPVEIKGSDELVAQVEANTQPTETKASQEVSESELDKETQSSNDQANQNKPEWHIDIPEQGLEILPSEEKGEGYRTLAGRVANDAVGSLTNNQKMQNDPLYLYYLPAVEGRNGIARFFPEDQTPPKPWEIVTGVGVRTSSLTNEQLKSQTSEALKNARIIGWGNGQKTSQSDTFDPLKIKNTQTQPNTKGGFKLIDTDTGLEVFEGRSFKTKSEGNKLLKKLQQEAINGPEKKAMFSNDTASKADTKITGSTVEQVLSWLPNKAKKLVDKGIIVIVQSIKDIPASVEGFYETGTDKIYLIADSLNAKNIGSVLAHELLHRALIIDPKLRVKVDGFRDYFFDRYKQASKGLGSSIENMAYKRIINAKTLMEDRPEEFMAYMVSEYMRNPNMLVLKMKRAIERFIGHVRAILIRSGLDLGLIKELTPADLSAMAMRYGTSIQGRGIDKGILKSAKTQGYKGEDYSEAVEWLRAKSKGLDMSKEARMERAKSMGFDIKTIFYHGTDANITEFDLSKQGKNTLNSGWFGAGISVTGIKEEANLYASGDNSVIYSVLINKGKSFIINDSWNPRISGETLRKIEKLKGWTTAEKETINYNITNRISVSQTFGQSEDISGYRLTEVLTKNGYSSVTVHNQVDYGKPKRNEEIVIFNPRAIRSINAAFDPDFKDSGNLLAHTAWNENNLGASEEWLRAMSKGLDMSLNGIKQRMLEISGSDKISTPLDAETGKPILMRLYHGTDQDITEFKDEILGFNTGAKSAEGGHYFTDNARAAARYPVYQKEVLLEYGGFLERQKNEKLNPQSLIDNNKDYIQAKNKSDEARRNYDILSRELSQTYLNSDTLKILWDKFITLNDEKSNIFGKIVNSDEYKKIDGEQPCFEKVNLPYFYSLFISLKACH